MDKKFDFRAEGEVNSVVAVATVCATFDTIAGATAVDVTSSNESAVIVRVVATSAVELTCRSLFAVCTAGAAKAARPSGDRLRSADISERASCFRTVSISKLSSSLSSQ